MAIAYVSVSGTGIYPGTALAPTSLSAALSTAAAGDTVYIATGTYRAAYTLSVSGSSGNAINFIGDCTNAQNINGASGYLVRITNYVSDTANPTDAPALTASARSYVNFNSIYFDAFSTTGVIALSAGTNITFAKCVFATTTTGHGVQHTMTSATGPALSLTQCIFVGNGTGYLWRQLGNYTVANMACYITDCLSIGGLWFVNGSGSSTWGQKYDNVYFYNNTVFQGSSNPAVQMQIAAPGTSTMYFYNNIIISTTALTNVVSTTLAENYNTFIGTRSNIVALSANDRTASSAGFAFDYGLLTGTVSIPFFAPYLGSVNQGAGTLSGAPATDLYSRAWSVTTPDIGSATNFANTGITAYLPTERNASTITIAPGSTSQSIELYLGATGLTASTSGLSARYNRTRTASVNIPLVARTIAQAWTAGGFAEVDATNMPGVYRLDLPDAALAAGADDVTIVVRGASGTNGAVMTIKLSSGGLSSTETAQAVWNATASSYNTAGSMGAAGQDKTGYALSTTGQNNVATAVWDKATAGYTNPTNFGGMLAEDHQLAVSTDATVNQIPNLVWDELTSTHTTHGSFGYNVLQSDQASKQGLVTLASSGNVNRVDADVHAIQNDTAAATELKGALLHNGTDYISADLVTPVTNAISPMVGPFTILPSGGGADNVVDLNVGTASPLALNLLDGSGAPFNASGSTITANVYTAGGSVVATYTGSITAGYIGAISIPLSTTVTANSATYTMMVSVVIGTTTTVFGPLKLVVRAI